MEARLKTPGKLIHYKRHDEKPPWFRPNTLFSRYVVEWHYSDGKGNVWSVSLGSDALRVPTYDPETGEDWEEAMTKEELVHRVNSLYENNKLFTSATQVVFVVTNPVSETPTR